MAGESNELAVVVRVKDFASRGLRRVLGGFKRFGGTAVNAIKRVRSALFSLQTLLVGALAGGAVKFFTSFESGMAQVSTLVDTAKVDMRALASGVQDVAIATGDSLESLSSGLFDAISAGVKAEDAVAFLGDAAKLGVGGGTDTASAIKGVVSLLNAYGLEASEAKSVSDSLFQAMKGGITTIGLLSSNVGKVAPIARQAGLGLDEMNAAIAALTKGGLSTEQATTALRATLQSLINPTDQSREAAKALGIQWDQQTLETYGLLQVLNQLNREGLKPTAEQQAALAGSIEGFVGVASLAADGGKNFSEILDTMTSKAGATDEAFAKVNETLGVKGAQAWNAFKVAVIDVVGVFADDLKSSANSFREWVSDNRDSIVAFTEIVRSSFRLLGVIITNFFSPDGNTAQAAVIFWTKTMVAILKAGLLALVEVVVVGGKTLGRALTLALGETVREGLNDLARDVAEFAVGPLGKWIAEKFGVDLRDFTLFEGSDEDIAKKATDDITKALGNLGEIGTEALDSVRAALKDLAERGSPEVAAAVDELQRKLDEFADTLSPRSGGSGPLAKIVDNVVAYASEAINAGLGVVSSGVSKTAASSTSGGRTDAQGKTLDQANVEIAARTAARLEALKMEALAKLGELEEAFPAVVKIAAIEQQAAEEIARFSELVEEKKLSEADFQRFRILKAEETQAAIDKILSAEGEQYLLTNQEIAGTIASNFTDAFVSIVDGTKSVGQAFAQMVQSILSSLGQLLVQRALIGLIGSLLPGGAGGGISVTPSALGNVFNRGKLQKFASGGVVNGPTAFPMSGGMGIMGEAGPEAILPLQRGAGGKLGVASGGAQAVTVNFNVVANDSKSFDDQLVQRQSTIRGIIREAISRDGTLRSSIAGVKRGR